MLYSHRWTRLRLRRLNLLFEDVGFTKSHFICQRYLAVDDLSAFINVLSACTSPSGDALEAFGVLAKKSSSILALSGPVGAVAAFAIHTVFTVR